MDSAGGKVIQSFGVLVNSLSNHTKDLQHLMKWRSGCTDASEIVGITQQLGKLEKNFGEIESFLQSEEHALSQCKAFHSRAVKQEQHLLKICKSLPDHLPRLNNVPVSPAKVSHEPAVDLENQPNFIQQKQQQEKHLDTSIVKTQKLKCKKNKRITPAIPFVTIDDLEVIPKYIRGRLKIRKINDGVNELNDLVLNKYKLLEKPPRKLGVNARSQVLTWRKQETAETLEARSCFFCAKDLKKAKIVNLGNDTGRCIIQVLQHTKRVTMMGGGGFKRYIITAVHE